MMRLRQQRHMNDAVRNRRISVRAVECILLCITALVFPWWLAGGVALVRIIKDARYELVCVAVILDALYGPLLLGRYISFTFITFCVVACMLFLRTRIRSNPMRSV
jgi:hypothetical protein